MRSKILKKGMLLFTLSLCFVLTCVLVSCDKTKNISTIQDLQALSTKMDNQDTYKLTKDLDLKDTEWQPIEVFYGTLDGNGHTISNLKLTNELSNGLFNVLRGKVINLIVEVEITGNYSGGIASKLENGGLIENCLVRGTIGSETSNYVGGIVGTLINSTIKNCQNFATITGNEIIGGIVGYAWSKYQNGSIEASTNFGTINGKYQVGGIVGAVFADATIDFTNPDSLLTYYFYLKQNINNGDVTASSDNVGGIAGHIKGTESKKRPTTEDDYQYAYGYLHLENCQNAGNITGNNNTGGIVGQAVQYIDVFTNCQNDGDIIGNNYVGGVIGRDKAGNISYLTNNGNVTGVDYIGGIAGSVKALTNSTNSGKINANRYAGGIAGQLISTTPTTDCENLGDVTGVSTNIGGVIGYCTQATTLEKCLNRGNVTSRVTSRVDGIIGYGPSVTQIDCIDYTKQQ